MAKKYTCEVCSETFVRDRRSRLVQVVQKHVDDEHQIKLKKDNIRDRVHAT